MVDLFAQYERAIIRSRTKAALAVKKARGERVGQVPYGFRLAGDGVNLVADPDESRIRTRIQALREQGLSYRAIAQRLNHEGHRARGRRWHPTTVVRILSEAG